MKVTKQLIPFILDQYLKYGDWVGEYKFHERRKYRLDYAFPEFKLGIEYEGIIKLGIARHTSIKGYSKDCEKYNAAALRGWTVLRYTAVNIQELPGDLDYFFDTVDLSKIKDSKI